MLGMFWEWGWVQLISGSATHRKAALEGQGSSQPSSHVRRVRDGLIAVEQDQAPH